MYCVVPKIHVLIPSPKMILFGPSHPLGICRLAPYFCLKFFRFRDSLGWVWIFPGTTHLYYTHQIPTLIIPPWIIEGHRNTLIIESFSSSHLLGKPLHLPFVEKNAKWLMHVKNCHSHLQNFVKIKKIHITVLTLAPAPPTKRP